MQADYLIRIIRVIDVTNGLVLGIDNFESDLTGHDGVFNYVPDQISARRANRISVRRE